MSPSPCSQRMGGQRAQGARRAAGGDRHWPPVPRPAWWEGNGQAATGGRVLPGARGVAVSRAVLRLELQPWIVPGGGPRGPVRSSTTPPAASHIARVPAPARRTTAPPPQQPPQRSGAGLDGSRTGAQRRRRVWPAPPVLAGPGQAGRGGAAGAAMASRTSTTRWLASAGPGRTCHTQSPRRSAASPTAGGGCGEGEGAPQHPGGPFLSLPGLTPLLGP